MAHDQQAEQGAKREAGLLRVQGWFAAAFAPDEVLVAALAANAYPLTMLNSLVGTAKSFVGRSPARVLLLTDRAIHVATRKFWKRRFKALLVSYPTGTVSVRATGIELWIGDESFFLNPSGYQMGGNIGTAQDVRLFVDSGRPAASAGP